MVQKYLSGVNVVDLSRTRGNGPFRDFRGVCLHVNVAENGTPVSFWSNNPGQVTPNFQVMKNGHIDQLLPFNWQPWCQKDGNYQYAAIETAGMPQEALTMEQMISIAKILKVYHDDMGMKLAVANTPGQRGFIIHSAGGQAWGGHACPGDIRAGQRARILRMVPGGVPPVANTKVLHRKWPSYMPVGHYFGLETGPNASHGGYYSSERLDIEAIQRRLRALNFYHGGDLPGHFRDDTKKAVAAWQRKHYASTTDRFGEVWHDDWNHLFTY